MPAQDLKRDDGNEDYSHIYNKAVEGRNLFNDQGDYSIFISYLKDYLTPAADSESVKKVFTVNGRSFRGVPHQPKNFFNKIDLIAYSLMPDHFHLLVREVEKGSQEKFVRSLCTRYAIYYNKKYQRRGSLFTGPYKSVDIKHASQLVHLTRYFHREAFLKTAVNNSGQNGQSSYQDYLGVRATSWIKPKVILAYFEKSENNYYKGTNGYKNFVEKYILKPEEKEMLGKIILDAKIKDVGKEVSGNTLIPEEGELEKRIQSKPIPEHRSSTPAYIASSSLVFILLFSFGVRNINHPILRSDALLTYLRVPTPSPVSQVAGTEDARPEEVTPTVPAEVTPVVQEEIQPVVPVEATPTVAENAETTPEAITPPPIDNLQEPVATVWLVVKITDGSDSVNLRQGPSVKFEVIGKAMEGDQYEFVSKESGWYQIKLSDGSNAYISPKYAVVEGEGGL